MNFLMIFLLAFSWMETTPAFADEVKDEKVAFADIKFGDSEGEVYSKIRSNPQFWLVWRNDYKTKLGDEEYWVKPLFYQNKLWAISFSSLQYPADYYYTKLKNRWQDLVQIISNKYGKTEGEFLNLYRIGLGQSGITNLWQVGTKKIMVSINEGEVGYYVSLYILDDVLHNQKSKEEGTQKDKILGEASKNF